MPATLTLRWVPNTLDRVHLSTPHGEAVVSIGRVRSLFGRDALEGLYLRDGFRLEATDPRWPRVIDAVFTGNAVLVSAAD